ncbi:hypothetical protein G6F40_017942 [Rhizopus arrhizus]|nr:hypothetical protein G6F40_017942 [Rhizopus arrhizus]
MPRGIGPLEQKRARNQAAGALRERPSLAGTRQAAQRATHHRASRQRVLRHRPAGPAFRARYRYADDGGDRVNRGRAVVSGVRQRCGLPLADRQGLLL